MKIQRNGTIIVLLVAGLFVIAVGLLSYKSTHHKSVPGYIEANLTYMSASTAGQLTELAIRKGQKVKKGQLLFTIDQKPYQLQLQSSQHSARASQAQYQDLLSGRRVPYIEQAKANIEKAKATLAYAKATFQRSKTLLAEKSISREKYDVDLQSYKQAQADVIALQKQLHILQLTGRQKAIEAAKETANSRRQQAAYQAWQLMQTEVKSPGSAYVFDTYYWPGEQVAAYQPVVSLIIPQQIKLVFYLSEVALANIKQGQQITFAVGNNRYCATIDYIADQAEYTPPVLYSESSRQDLSYKIEAQVNNRTQAHWHLGQPVSIYLNASCQNSS